MKILKTDYPIGAELWGIRQFFKTDFQSFLPWSRSKLQGIKPKVEIKEENKITALIFSLRY